MVMVGTIGVCFLAEIFFARPDAAEIARGFIPSLPDRDALYYAIGILGATVMPHNLYLHSSLVQSRKVGEDVARHPRSPLKYNIIDSVVALNMAFFVNAAHPGDGGGRLPPFGVTRRSRRSRTPTSSSRLSSGARWRPPCSRSPSSARGRARRSRGRSRARS